MLEKTDPRVVLCWWICTSTIAFYAKSAVTIGLLFATLLFMWTFAGKLKKLVSFVVRLSPLVVFIVFLFRNETWQLVFALRIITIIGSTVFMMSMGNAKFTNALHNMNINIPVIETLVKLISEMFAEALMTFSVVASELRQLQEIQLARGVNINSLNPFVKVRHSIQLAVPLLSRMFSRHSYVGRTSEILGYDPFAKRSIYGRLTLKWYEKLLIVAMIGATFSALVIGV